MKSQFTLADFQQRLIEIFTNADQPVYAQVASVDDHGLPQLRTVHLRYWQQLDCLCFNSNTKAPKWRQLQRDSHIAGCYYDGQRDLQLRWEANVDLIDNETSNTDHTALLDHMWRITRAAVRTVYWKDHQPQQFDIQQRCPTFATVMFRPHCWDILEVSEDYLNSCRTLFIRSDKAWQTKRVSVLHGKEI